MEGNVAVIASMRAFCSNCVFCPATLELPVILKYWLNYFPVVGISLIDEGVIHFCTSQFICTWETPPA